MKVETTIFEEGVQREMCFCSDSRVGEIIRYRNKDGYYINVLSDMQHKIIAMTVAEHDAGDVLFCIINTNIQYIKVCCSVPCIPMCADIEVFSDKDMVDFNNQYFADKEEIQQGYYAIEVPNDDTDTIVYHEMLPGNWNIAKVDVFTGGAV